MTTSLQNVLHRGTVAQAHPAATRRTTTHTLTFQNVLQSATTSETSTPAKASSTGVTVDDGLKHLGPFTGDPNAKATVIPDPAPLPTATYTPLPANQQALLNQPWDPFNKTQHEAGMNNWYMNLTQHANQQKLQIYQQAVADWKVNAGRCRDLGMQTPPPPQVPVLEAVGPMPDGYWFATHS